MELLLALLGLAAAFGMIWAARGRHRAPPRVPPDREDK
jgi:hypothetical protein